jgi:hypothetical protein
MTTTETRPRVTRETLEDRWAGLVAEVRWDTGLDIPAWHGRNTKLWEELEGTIGRLVTGLARTDIRGQEIERIVMDVCDTVRIETVRLVDESGIAQVLP